jgi:8-oxo-dGTP pyrophosphatase MutT (NUDIX family)
MRSFKMRLTAIAFGTASACAGAWALPPAGILAHACDSKADGAVYLLAEDLDATPKPAWGHFGGKAEGEETPEATALREFNEETNCAFPPAILRVQDLRERTTSGKFVTFRLRVPFVEGQVIENRDRAQCKDVERRHWVWIRHVDLVAALSLPDPAGVSVSVFNGSRASVELWPESADAMRRALWERGTPKPDPCR